MNSLPEIPPASVSIAVMTDIHYGEAVPGAIRRSESGAELVALGVNLLNERICPDVVLVLGDVVDDGASPEAENRWQRIRSILDQLAAPYLAIPGNHDHDEERFYRIFKRPGEIEEIAGIRFLAFTDRQEPGFHAARSERDLKRILRAREQYEGMLVTFQHVCLHPDHAPLTPYRYTNSEAVISALKAARVALSISGHYHTGAELLLDEGLTFINAPGLCEPPFPLLEVNIENGRIHTRRHSLAGAMEARRT